MKTLQRLSLFAAVALLLTALSACSPARLKLQLALIKAKQYLPYKVNDYLTIERATPEKNAVRLDVTYTEPIEESGLVVSLAKLFKGVVKDYVVRELKDAMAKDGSRLGDVLQLCVDANKSVKVEVTGAHSGTCTTLTFTPDELREML